MPWLSKKQIRMVWIFDLLIFAFFGRGDLLVCHSELCCFCCEDRIQKSTFHHPLWHVWKNFCHFRCVQEGPGTHSFGFPSVHWWEFLGPAWHKFSACPVWRSKFRGRFGNSNSTHYWSFWLSDVEQTSQDPSLWSHFHPFLTCKVFQNEVRLPHSHAHPKMLYAT